MSQDSSSHRAVSVSATPERVFAYRRSSVSWVSLGRYFHVSYESCATTHPDSCRWMITEYKLCFARPDDIAFSTAARDSTTARRGSSERAKIRLARPFAADDNSTP